MAARTPSQSPESPLPSLAIHAALRPSASPRPHQPTCRIVTPSAAQLACGYYAVLCAVTSSNTPLLTPFIWQNSHNRLFLHRSTRKRMLPRRWDGPTDRPPLTRGTGALPEATPVAGQAQAGHQCSEDRLRRADEVESVCHSTRVALETGGRRVSCFTGSALRLLYGDDRASSSALRPPSAPV